MKKKILCVGFWGAVLLAFLFGVAPAQETIDYKIKVLDNPVVDLNSRAP